MKAKTTIGIDIGGTKIRVGRVSPSGKIIDSLRVLTEAKKGSAAVLKNIIQTTEKLWTKEVKQIGVGIAGVVDHEKGVFLGGPNLPKAFRNVPIAALLKKRFSVPVKVDNDVHCFTLAEAKVGAGKGLETVVGLTFGTGIGGGIVIGGKLLRGRNNAAGEFGHAVIGMESPFECGCGRKGHFEAFASGNAMSKIYRRLSGRSLEPIEIEKAAHKGNRKAKQTLDLMADAMVSGLASVIHILNPDVVVVGGGLSAINSLWNPVMKRLKAQISYASLRNTPVVRSSLGTDANILGATLLFSEKE